MLLELGLRNFKAFGEKEQKAPLSKITLIYGPNSGGKSSIIQALLMLKQSLYSDQGSGRRELIPRGEYVDLGSFSALLHKHDTKRELGISVNFAKLLYSAKIGVHMTFVASESREKDSSVLSKVGYQIIDETEKEKKELLLDAKLEYNFNENSWDLSQLSIVGDDSRAIFSEMEEFPAVFLPTMKLQWNELLTSVRKSRRELGMELEWKLGSTLGRELGRELGRALERALERNLGIELGRTLVMAIEMVREREWLPEPEPRLEWSRARALALELGRALGQVLGQVLGGALKQELGQELGGALKRALGQELGGALGQGLQWALGAMLVRGPVGVLARELGQEQERQELLSLERELGQELGQELERALGLELGGALGQERRELLNIEQELREALSPIAREALEQVLEQVQEQTREEVQKLKWVQILVIKLMPRLKPEQILDLTTDISQVYNDLLKSITYLGPLRSYPERLYTISGRGRESTGIRGEFTPHILYYSSDIQTKVNQWFESFEIPYDLKISEFGDVQLAGKYVSIALIDKNTNTPVTLADVGFGINQLLPIITEGLTPEANEIICVEQPEIHLHPRLQANIADLMIDTIRDEEGKRKQWIVETHSELLIRRIQRRIREGTLTPNDVSVLYVDPGDDGSKIEVLELDEDGDFIDEWPHGFFDEGFNELMAK